MRHVKIDYFFAALLALASFLIFLNLGNQYLWQDEAENAVIAKNILTFGYPRAYDGSLLVVSDIGYRNNYTWIFQPWLQNYVTAASLYFLGRSSFSARLPFAIFGLFSFVLAYYLARRLFQDNTAKISGVLLLFCVPLLLMIRSARYYSLALFFGLTLIYSYLDYAENKKYSGIKVFLSSLLLFNSNFGIFFPLFAGLSLHYIIFYYEKRRLGRDVKLLAAIALGTLPVFIYFKGWEHKVPLTVDFILGNINFYFRSLNRYIVPIRFFLIVYIIMAVLKRSLVCFKLSSAEKRSLSLIGIVTVVTVIFLGIAKFRSLRYAIVIIPMLIIFESFILSRWMKYHKFLSITFIIVLITTDLFHHSVSKFISINFSRGVAAIGEKADVFKNSRALNKLLHKAKKSASKELVVRSYMSDYLYEITHDYDGPVEGVVRYLKENAQAGDTVMIPYGDCAVAFYTDLKVTNKMELRKGECPEWIVRREYWAPEEFYNLQEIQRNYAKIVLDFPDLRWENRPDDMGYHNFSTVTDCPRKVIIYKRI